ncbi:hypothetical protein JW905_01035 [bacterium]|nr:hypothetical protein [candidate division CSSED10-310 bacterium]
MKGHLMPEIRDHVPGICISLILVCMTATAGAQVTVTRLTTNDYEDLQPTIDGSGVAWFGCPGNECNPFFGNYEIYYWNTMSTMRVTDTEEADRYPQVSSGTIAWIALRDDVQHIVRWNGQDEEILSEYSTRNDQLDIEGDQMVWQGRDADDTEIWLWRNGMLAKLSNNSVEDEKPRISGDQVVWVQASQGIEDQREIMLWNGMTLQRLTDDSYDDDRPAIDNGVITWQGFDGNDWEIYLWLDGVTTRLTDNQVDDLYPVVNGFRIAWQQGTGTGSEIMVWNAGDPRQLTANGYPDEQPAIDEWGTIVWQACPDNDCPFFGGGNWEVFWWRDGSQERITDNDTIDYYPKPYRNSVTWMGYVGGNMEVFVADVLPPSPTPAVFTPTPAPPSTTLELTLNQFYYRSGERFLLQLTTINSRPVIRDLYIVLDVFGHYWFWPDWVDFPDIDYQRRTIAAGTGSETILDFNWPANAGEASGIFFWTILTEPGTYTFASNIDSVAFSYGM